MGGGAIGIVTKKVRSFLTGSWIGFEGDLGPQLQLVVVVVGAALERIETAAQPGTTPESSSLSTPPPLMRLIVKPKQLAVGCSLSRARDTGEEPAQSTEAQRSWVYSHDPVVKYHYEGVPVAPSPKGLSLDVGEGPRAAT